MKKETLEALHQWLAKKAYLNQQQKSLAVSRQLINNRKSIIVDLDEEDQIDPIVLKYKADNLLREIKAHEQQLVRILEEYASEINQEYILKQYGNELSETARFLFQKEIDETIRSMCSHKYKYCTQRFRLFLEKGCEVFVEGHRISAGQWKQETEKMLGFILKREELASQLRKVLRSDPVILQRLLKQVRLALDECYAMVVRGYNIRVLRKEVQENEKLKAALAKAEMGFDYAEKYAGEMLLDYIPDDYAYLYPAARTIDRHFILHIGPTNSGKTYTALKAMHYAQDGIYLAPLRLLAYEQFDSMNKDGIYCSLKTGEEQISVPGAKVQSCTIEMLDEHHYYDVVIIDEAQMVQDPMRGGHWTKAILGAWAKEIHVCLAPEAEQIVIRMIEQCQDTYEIIRHERYNALVPDETTNVHFPKQVEDGDAYIVFSRSSAHACVAELQRRGINPSIIYGALPYDVRQNEARRFREGETSVVVATDAIGMGLNLPIRRVVFLETEKFDGVKRRSLNASEYKQIAGRAGRYGQYEQGMYVSPYQMKWVVKAVSEPIPPIESAHLLFPDTLLGVDAPLSSILQMWNVAPVKEGYSKEDVTQEILLADFLEHYSKDKKLIYSLVSMPFDAQRENVFSLWKSLALECVQRHQVKIEKYMPDIGTLCQKGDLEELESSYRQYDLLYYFAERFDQTMLQRLIDERKTVSSLMMQILVHSRLPLKTCRKCGRHLPWNSPFHVCGQCN